MIKISPTVSLKGIAAKDENLGQINDHLNHCLRNLISEEIARKIDPLSGTSKTDEFGNMVFSKTVYVFTEKELKEFIHKIRQNDEMNLATVIL